MKRQQKGECWGGKVGRGCVRVCVCVKLRGLLLFARGVIRQTSTSKHILQACFQILKLVLELLVYPQKMYQQF